MEVMGRKLAGSDVNGAIQGELFFVIILEDL
jgi:hypothetical protein